MADERVVIRGPLTKSEGVTRAAMLGEMCNVAHAALRGYGLHVAFFSWVREVKQDKRVEGLVEVHYRLLSVLERADTTVAERVKKLVSTGIIDHNPLQWTARKREVYFEQLLETVWAYSVDGGVHLDATLRNFVDLPATDPSEVRPRIRVIDMDRSVFRRLLGMTRKDCQWLWLHNVLIVSCFLKVAFEDHPEFRRVWDRIRRPSATHEPPRRAAGPGPRVRCASAVGHRGVRRGPAQGL